jgi:hypothetical protein
VILHQVRIACSTPGCESLWPVDGWAETTWREAWNKARDAGWQPDYDQHLCPTCSPQTQRVVRIRQLAALGLSDAGIGARLGLSRSQVQNARRRNRIPGRRPGRPRTGDLA